MRIFSLLLLVAACGATTNQLKTRAAYDLHCSEAELQVIDMDSRTDRVVGCGKEAIYTTDCQDNGIGGVSDCTWRLDSASIRDAQPIGTEGGLCKRVGENSFSCQKGLMCKGQTCVRE